MNNKVINEPMDYGNNNSHSEQEEDSSVIFEVIKGIDSYIKAIVLRDGVKHEINVVSISENEVANLVD